jgi:hypothetical protein
MTDPLSDAAFSDLLDSQAIAVEDQRLHVTFFYDEWKDEAATAREGRPIFKSVEMCEIRIPGDKDNIRIDRVSKMHPDPRERFPVQYAKFKAGEKVQISGTLLREGGPLDRATAKGYEALDVYTVEQLASVSDQVCQQHRGMVADRQKARDWLETAKGQAPVAAARAEAEKLRAEVRALREQIADLGGGRAS